MITSIPITAAGIGGLGPWELIIVLAIVLVVFGAGKLPRVGSAMGESIKNFKKALKEPSSPSSDDPKNPPNSSS